MLVARSCLERYWSGVMSSDHWGVCKLKDITLKIGSGSTPLGGEKVYTDSGVILLRSQNIGWGYILTDNLVYISDEIDSQMSKTRVMGGDILLNIAGISSIGRCCIIPQGFSRANVNQHVCIIRPDPSYISPEYLIKVFLSEYIQSQIKLHSTGATRKGLDFERVGNFLVPVPNLDQQQAIANFLDTKTSSINNYLKFKSSKLTNLVDAKTHIYNFIKNDYKTTRLKYIATIIPGKSLSNKPVLTNFQQVNVVSFKHVLDDNIATSDLQSGNVSSDFLVKNKLEYNDVLLTGEGDYHLLGRSGLFKNKTNNYVAGNGVYVIRVNQALIDPEFLSVYIRTATCKNYFSTHNLAAHYPPLISLTDLKNLSVPLIPLPDQKQIAASIKSKISKINSCINLVQSQIKLMEEYRKSLIFEAVTGKLDI